MDSATQIIKPASISVPSTPNKRRGVFDSKEGWKCSCNPSAPALYRQTKKENVNKGRWFFRCHKWHDGCDFFLWADEAQAVVDETTQYYKHPESSALQGTAPPAYKPPELPAWVQARTPVPSPRSRDNEGKKRTAGKRQLFEPEDKSDEEEDNGDLTDVDVEVTTTDSSRYSDVPYDTTDDETPTNAFMLGGSRKERRTSTKNSPSKETARAGSASTRARGSFATTSSFATAQTSFTSTPMTPSSGHRKRRSRDAEEDIFTTAPLSNRPTNNLISKLVSASNSKGSTFTPETPKERREKRLSFQLASPTSPDSPRGQPGLQTPSSPAQDVFSFYPELGKISTELQNKLVELMHRQARQAEGFRRARDVNRKLLREKSDEVTALRKRLEELEREKETTRQINENLKSQLDMMRLQSE